MTTTRYYRGGVTQVTTDKSGRWYEWQGEKFYSVTSIISGGVPKPALINWAKKFTAEYAVDNFEGLRFRVETEGDREAAVAWLKDAAWRERDRKADLGTWVHDVAEATVLGKPLPTIPDDAVPYARQVQAFLEDQQPEFVAAEATCLSREQRYGGRLDFIAHLPKLSKTVLGDYKTGSGIYPETALQLAAYRFADTFLGLPDTSEAPVPEVDGAVAIHLTPEQYAIIPVKADELAYRTFLYAREIYRWQLEGSKVAVGEPLSVGGDQLELWVTA